MLEHWLSSMIETGGFIYRRPDGEEVRIGRIEGDPIIVHVTDRASEVRILSDPWLEAGEAYMDERLRLENGDLGDFLGLIMRNADPNGHIFPGVRIGRPLRMLMRKLGQINTQLRAVRNASAHYERDPVLYEGFLDPDMQYSCAYYREPGMTLAEAQFAKKEHIARKLCLEPGQEVLDIGCGWGGLALHLAAHHGVRVTAINVCSRQLDHARERARAAGLAERVEFRLADYRAIDLEVDRIVSVGMFEHVGLPHYRTFFDCVARQLRPHGVALLHAIGRSTGPGTQNPWIARHIFPGGYNPALSEVMAAIEPSGLYLQDFENLKPHYAMTLRDWRRNFHSRLDTFEARYGARFCRMWDFYLAACEACFRDSSTTVFQMQLVGSPEAVPVTRDYIYAVRAAQADAAGREPRSVSSRHEAHSSQHEAAVGEKVS